jgi:hypothetical protein
LNVSSSPCARIFSASFRRPCFLLGISFCSIYNVRHSQTRWTGRLLFGATGWLPVCALSLPADSVSSFIE